MTGAVTATKAPKPGCDVWNPSTQEAEIKGSEVQSSLVTVNLRIAGTIVFTAPTVFKKKVYVGEDRCRQTDGLVVKSTSCTILRSEVRYQQPHNKLGIAHMPIKPRSKVGQRKKDHCGLLASS